VSKTKSKPRPKTRWPREFKLRAVARMDETANITALAKELGVSGSCCISGVTSSNPAALAHCTRSDGH
jgi:hypothetical protein